MSVLCDGCDSLWLTYDVPCPHLHTLDQVVHLSQPVWTCMLPFVCLVGVDVMYTHLALQMVSPCYVKVTRGIGWGRTRVTRGLSGGPPSLEMLPWLLQVPLTSPRE